MVVRNLGFMPVTVGASLVATAGVVVALLFIAIAGFTSADAAGAALALGAELAPGCKKLKNPPPAGAAGAAGALMTGGASLVATGAVVALLFMAMAGFTSDDAAGAELALGAEVAPTPGADCKKLNNPPPAAGAAGAWIKKQQSKYTTSVSLKQKSVHKRMYN